MLAQTHDAGHLRPVISHRTLRAFCPVHYHRIAAMTNLLILTEVQESMRARYKAMLLEQFPQLTINVVGHHNLVEPYIADTDILLCFSPPMADHVVRDAPEAEMDPGARHRRRQHRRPALARQRGAGHQYPRHPWRAGVGSHHRLHALARARPAALGPRARRSAWERWPSQLLAGKTVGILGVGLIAEYLAPICKPFGMTVIGISGSPRAAKGFDRMVARGDLVKVAGELDYLVALAPLTPETRNIVGAKLLAAMKPSAYLVNVARGGVVDEPALIGRARSRQDRRRRARRVRAGAAAAGQARCGRRRT